MTNPKITDAAVDLLPCPFCGSPAEWGHHDCSNGEHHRCTGCGVEMPGPASSWNRRAALPHMQQAGGVDVGEVQDCLVAASRDIVEAKLDRAQSFIREALTILAATPAQPEAGVPEGYVLVPVEPTEAMLAAAHRKPDERALWNAMLAAAGRGG